MEKQAKSKNKFMKFLPRAVSAITFQSPFSPTRDKRLDIANANKLKTHVGIGFSGPLVSLISAESRWKPMNSGGVGFEEAQEIEPTSPKVSCMGQIKHKHKNKKKIKKTDKHASLPRDFRPVSPAKKKLLTFRKSDGSAADKPTSLPDRAPSLSQMRRFASGRDSVTKFDWSSQIMPVDGDDDHRSYYSDEESEREESEVFVPFSAPIMVGRGGVGLEQRKEINLWKRRTTMAQPRPLQVNTLHRPC